MLNEIANLYWFDSFFCDQCISTSSKKINAFNDGKLDGVNVAQNISGMPDYVYESIKRQYSGKDLDYKADRKKHADYYKMMETEFFDD